MYKEDWSWLTAKAIQIVVVCLFGGLAIKLMIGMSRCGNPYMAAFGYFLPVVACIIVIAIVISPSLAEKCSDSLFNFLYPEPNMLSNLGKD